MLARAGLHSKPSSSQILSSALSVIISRVHRGSPPTGDHFVMSNASPFSNFPNFSIAAAAAQSIRGSRHSHCTWRTEQMHVSPVVHINQSIGSSPNVTIQPRVSGISSSLSRDDCSAAGSCSSSEPCSARCALSTGPLIWQGRGSEDAQRAINSGPGFVSWSTVKKHKSASCVSFLSRTSSLVRVRTHGLEPWDGFRSKLHTASRREGRYICASVYEDCIIETEDNGVGIDDEIAGPVETARKISGEVEGKKICTPEVWVVNFYHFVSIEDPHLEVARHTSFMEGRDVRGRIYISHQGINAQLSGPYKETVEYAEWVKEDPRFSNILVQISPSPVGHAFPRLRLRYKPSLVQVEGGTLHLPITDPAARAVHLTPREWTERLDAVTMSSNHDIPVSQDVTILKDGHRDETSGSTLNATRPVILLDVRNGYEWDVGHFKGALRPNVECFKSTEFGLSENETVSSDPLANVDKEAVDVMMYCTGGIRCDVFSTMLRQKGFKNLYTLKGGVSNYLKEEGARKWAGNLFVFDSRLAVPPKAYHTIESHEPAAPVDYDMAEERNCARSSTTLEFARCRLCGDPISEPRHRNCANLDCNLLFMSCEDCLLQQKGCCSQSCLSAPKLRPLLANHQYDRWHNYRPQEPKPPKPADYVSRRALKRRRRKERRKQLTRDTAGEQPSLHILGTHVSIN